MPSFRWLGLPATRRTLPLMDASGAIPGFVRRPFRLASAAPLSTVNPYYEVVVRLPMDEDPAEVPVGLVSKSYQLVQHHEILQRTASVMASLEIDLNRIETTLDLTVYGERMALGIVFPTDSKYSFSVGKGDIMALYLEFINSVDGSMRLALRVSWLRLVCKNGLMMREMIADFSRMHIGGEVFKEFEDQIPLALDSVLDHKKLFQQWMKAKVADDRFEAWLEETVRKAWGLKAAVRVYHIVRRGVDVEIEKMLGGMPVAVLPTRDRACVVGAFAGDINVFAISQALSWLAGDRGELQE